MDECMVTTSKLYDSMCTKALGPCIAICGRSKNESGDVVMGLYHYSGIESAKDAIEHLIESIQEMRENKYRYSFCWGMCFGRRRKK